MKKISYVFFALLSLNSFAGNGNYLKMTSNNPSSSGTPVKSPKFTSEYEASKVIFRVNEKYRNVCGESGINEEKLKNAASVLGGKFEKIFPGKTYDENMKTRSGLKPVDLSLLYSIQYSNDVSVERAKEILLKTGCLDFAEPAYIMRPMYTPNDTSNFNQATYQYSLDNIKAYQAYDFSKGDTSIVIGITDSGVNTFHDDLKGNIAYNYADPINGIDDDHDGYLDNFKGWDLASNSNNPDDTLNHGTGVAGIAAASTDNITGMIGVGFKCRFLPVKIAKGGSFTKSYEGIVYSADHGCKVINCSWGGTGGGFYGQMIVDYASINMDAVVVASAGNSNSEVPFYPATYEHVISVASVSWSDTKTFGSGGSSFGYYVDISAPGLNLYTCRSNGIYTFFNGTSAAAPVISGCAGILRAQFPNYNALQIAEQLRITADFIDTISGNAAYKEKLGNGRANLFNAVSATAESVRMSQFLYADNNDQILTQGDTINISALFTNYLKPASALSVSLSSSSSHVILIDSIINIGAMNTMGTFNNNSNPFRIKLSSGLSMNEKILLRFSFLDGSYTDHQYFEITVNADYVNLTVNEISTTINSKGCFGYSAFPQLEGLGFDYKGNNLLYAGGLMIGNASNAVSDNVYGSNLSVADNDFVSVSAAKRLIPAVTSDFDVSGEFNDSGSPNKLNVSVKHNAYAWSSAGNRKFVILKYNIRNTGVNTLSNLYAGIFADWDIMNYAMNRCSLDVTNNLAYAFSTEPGGLFAGIRLLSSGNLKGYMDDNDGSSGGIMIYDGFSSSEKFTMLSGNRPAAGVSGQGTDICMNLSSGPFFLTSGDSVTVAFALLAGDSAKEMQSVAQAAQLIYDMDIVTASHEIKLDHSLKLFPNPVNERLYIFSEDNTFSGKIIVDIADLLGRRVFSSDEILPKDSRMFSVPTSTLSPGIYLLKMKMGGRLITEKFVVERY
jgi:serine protease